MTEQMDELRKWIVNDYFTPIINAEVILNTLLTPYVAEILKAQGENTFGKELCFITKEMSIPESRKSGEMSAPESEKSKKGSGNGNMGTKIDYILGDEKAIYLVELKTADSSIKLEQARRYVDNCRGKKFGEVFGNQLLRIMRDSFGDTYKRGFPEPSGKDNDGKPIWNRDKALEEAFASVFIKFGEKNGINVPPGLYVRGQYTKGQYTEGEYAGAAMKLIQKACWAQKDNSKIRSRKYLYTAGQLLDYCHDHKDSRCTLWDTSGWDALPDASGDGGHSGCTLWDKELRLIYLTLGGNPWEESEERSRKNSWKEFEEKYGDFYLGSFSLKKAGEYLEKKQGDGLALLLSDIIKDIYP